MKLINKIVLVSFLSIFFLVGCERPFNFNQELYENVVYLLSDNDNFNQYDRAIVDLKKDEDVVYITVGVSGSLSTPNPVDVELALDFDSINSLWGKYNKSNFDIEYDKWIKILPKKYYRFDDADLVSGKPGSIKATIPAGEMSVSIPVYVKNMSELSPDSLYVLDFKITSSSIEKINKDKNEVMIPVYWKNNWSNTKNPISYDLSGKQGSTRSPQATQLGDVRAITSNPTLYPLAKNKVRMQAGIEDISKTDTKSQLEMINENSIVVVINDDNTIDFEKYNQVVGLTVEKVDENSHFADEFYNNTYVTKTKTNKGTTTHYKTFKLNYRYRKGAKWIYCKVELSKEYNINED